MHMSDEKKLFVLEADTLDELALKFIEAAALTGEFCLFKTDSRNPKTWGKLAITGGRTSKLFDASFTVEEPNIRINGLQPESVNLTMQLSNLQKPSVIAQNAKGKAATIKADFAAMLRKVQAAGVDVSDVLGNAAGE
jgi:hypothetical protein